MPQVVATETLAASPDVVWQRVIAVTEFPSVMDSVRRIEELSVQQHPDGTIEAVVGWEVDFDGAVLRWIEREVRDPSTRVVTFNQVSGDLSLFEGTWRVVAREGGGTDTELRIEFEIGLPMLSEVLDPYATRLIKDNSSSMLRSLDRPAGATVADSDQSGNRR